jgi:hypothetical protein
MTVRKTVGTVGTLAHEAVATAVSVAKHPIGSTALAAGFVKGAAGAGIDFLRGTVPGASSTPPSDTPREEVPAQRLDAETEADTVEDTAPSDEPAEATAEASSIIEEEREQLPGPDLAEFEPPRPEDLPEPIVIEADDTPGEAFHTEPKAANRASAHGGPPGDHEEIEGYVEEIPTDDVDIETPVATTGADVAYNPDTAEADLQQPGTPEVLDPGVVSQIESESEILRKAADPRPE